MIAETADQATTTAAASGAEMLDQLEGMLEQIASEGRSWSTMSGAEMAFVASIGFDRQRFGDELRRVSGRRKLEAEALTPQRRGQLRKAADEARGAADERLPEIQQEIARLQREQRDLEQRRDQAEAEASKAEQAAAALDDVKHLPRHRRRAWSQLRHEIHERHKPTLKPLNDRAQAVRACLKLQPETVYDDDHRRALVYAQKYAPELVVEESDETSVTRAIDRAAFAEHQAQLRADLPTLEAELAEAEQAREAELAEAWQVFNS